MNYFNTIDSYFMPFENVGNQTYRTFRNNELLICENSSRVIYARVALRSVAVFDKSKVFELVDDVPEFQFNTTAHTNKFMNRSVSNEDIGLYVNVGNDINESGVTTDDWQLLYVDDEKIYIIAANKLSTSLYPTSDDRGEIIGLPRGIFSDSESYMFQFLRESKYWNHLTNNLYGAVAKGGPSYDILSKSYAYVGNGVLKYSIDGKCKQRDVFVKETDYLFSDGNGSTRSFMDETGNVGVEVMGSPRCSIPVIELPKNSILNIESK